MAFAISGRAPNLRSSWTRSLPIAALVLLAQTPSVADSPCDTSSAGSARSAVSPDDTRDALLRALDAYSAGDIAAAQAWTERAKALLDRAPRPDASGRKWIVGNSEQLLHTLELYAVYVYGQHVKLDAEFDTTVAWLRRVDFENRSLFGASRNGGATVSTDPFTHLATRIGDLVIDYDAFTLQIRRLGDVHIDYNAFTRLPERIGGIDIHYDPFNGRPTRIADVDLR